MVKRVPVELGWYEFKSRLSYIHGLNDRNLACLVLGIITPVFGLVGPLSVYCDCLIGQVDPESVFQCGSTSNCLSKSFLEMHFDCGLKRKQLRTQTRQTLASLHLSDW